MYFNFHFKQENLLASANYSNVLIKKLKQSSVQKIFNVKTVLM